MSGPLTREEAIERLAKQLYWTLHRLDVPTFLADEFADWDKQNEYVRDSYKEVIEDMVLDTEAIARALDDNGQQQP